MKTSFFSFITLVVMSFFVISCGQTPSNVLTAVKVETRTQGEDVWLSFGADLNLGAMSFASVSVPILHPRGQTPIGQLELSTILGGANQLKISLNVSELTDLDTTSATLPNGNMVPLIANNQVIAVEVGQGARIYLAISEKVTALGVAVPIGAFDNIGRTLPGLNLFPIVQTGDVIGTAGIFTSNNSGQNGIAVVADLSKVVNLGRLLSSSSSMLLASEEKGSASSLELDYRSHNIGEKSKSSLDKMMFELNRRRAVLRMK